MSQKVRWNSVRGGNAAFTWSDTNFDDVSPGQNQLLHHLSGHHVPCLTKTNMVVKNCGVGVTVGVVAPGEAD